YLDRAATPIGIDTEHNLNPVRYDNGGDEKDGAQHRDYHLRRATGTRTSAHCRLPRVSPPSAATRPSIRYVLPPTIRPATRCKSGGPPAKNHRGGRRRLAVAGEDGA